MNQFRHLSLLQVLKIHQSVLKAHGGSDGIRSRELLESALNAPQATFGGEPIFKDKVDIAAAYLFYLCSNHPFIDGNKRVALASALIILKINGLTPSPDSAQWEQLTLDVASSKLDRNQTTARLRLLLTA